MQDQGVERRLAAILAADVVGYSRLMEADEAGTLARLKTIRLELIDPAIAKCKGLVKTTGDEGFLGNLHYQQHSDAEHLRDDSSKPAYRTDSIDDFSGGWRLLPWYKGIVPKYNIRLAVEVILCAL